MILEGPAVGTNGVTLRPRMTFTPLPDGHIRQQRENSSDGGKSWTSAFDS